MAKAKAVAARKEPEWAVALPMPKDSKEIVEYVDRLLHACWVIETLALDGPVGFYDEVCEFFKAINFDPSIIPGRMTLFKAWLQSSEHDRITLYETLKDRFRYEPLRADDEIEE
jgi:hypothetical protein